MRAGVELVTAGIDAQVLSRGQPEPSACTPPEPWDWSGFLTGAGAGIPAATWQWLPAHHRAEAGRSGSPPVNQAVRLGADGV
ncbi:hypothetical protein GCM10023170_096990 [Phytohabitans houttuyneae]|uniref:Uncharacterized protein n=1 Tax=Phytohabitans houttuyneae TaxID=1076126 RepID=A0A6V8KI07_9ACTN|nr:hypothetical protein Phou_062810 [Phytohabitans houttuyneae]